MRHLRTIFLVLVLMVAFISGCLSTTGPAQGTSNALESSSSTSYQTPGERGGNETISTTAITGLINGTFSGYLTAPSNVFNEVRTLLEKTNATLYSFRVNVVGENLNASITLYALKLVPPFVPRDFNVTINGRPLNGTVFVAYADKIPVAVETKNESTTSHLIVEPGRIFDVEGTWDAQRLNGLNGSVILRNDCLELRVSVRKLGDYVFEVFHNGTEISSGGLEVGS